MTRTFNELGVTMLPSSHICPVCNVKADLTAVMPNIESVAEWEGFYGKKERFAVCFGHWDTDYYFLHFYVELRETDKSILRAWQQKMYKWKRAGKPTGKKPPAPYRQSHRILRLKRLPDNLLELLDQNLYYKVGE